MAEVLPMQSSTTITLLHTRPSSADAFTTVQSYHQPQRLTNQSRSMYNGQNNGFRAASSVSSSYSAPNVRQEGRAASAPPPLSSGGPFGNHKPTESTSTTSSDSSAPPLTNDETPKSSPRPESLINISQTMPDLSFTSFDLPSNPAPEKIRRPTGKRTESMTSDRGVRIPSPAPAPAAVNHQRSASASHVHVLQRQNSYEDLTTQRSGLSETGKRDRRRSLNQLDTRVSSNETSSHTSASTAPRPGTAPGHYVTSTPTTIKPVSLSAGESETANGPRQPQTIKSVQKTEQTTQSISTTTTTTSQYTVPSRASPDSAKRLAAPSPLSRQTVEMDSPPTSPTPAQTRAKTGPTLSPAAQQLAAVSDRDLNKGMKSRLRRAFSFGSAQELRRAGVDTSQPDPQLVRQQHQQQIDDELDAEQLEIARRQEAAGIGAGIYSGQGGFAGSTDNLSISSTASSASMMLRKMGRGAKKSAKSIKGLFRPKSVVGVPAADSPIASVEPTVGQVSMVTVEAERRLVNVNAHADEHTDGGTSFPKLERNSLESAVSGVLAEQGSPKRSEPELRRSVVGNDKDRAEVLAAVRKGILKRSGTASPTASPVVQPTDAAGGLPSVPQFTDSPPASSIPSTPREVYQNRSVSAPAVNGDYFNTRMGVAKSMPNTPNGSVRSISFSPRIQFHDAWSSTEYDRRGEIATCNRLTPLLAQQIKEELNTLKMEMEVHELSKPHTHFF